jgi:hypothetical protein
VKIFPRALITALAGFLLAGCAIKPEFVRKPWATPPTIAVLPFANESNSIDAPVFMQKLAADGLSAGGYAVIPLADVNERLRKAGITVGGQLGSKTPQELARITGASAVLYGNVKSFNYTTLGFYQKREVALQARLVGEDGTEQWRQSATASRTFWNFQAMENLRETFKAMGVQLAVKLVEKLISHPLYPEMLRSTHDLFITLPSPRGGSVGKYCPRGYNDFWRDITQ